MCQARITGDYNLHCMPFLAITWKASYSSTYENGSLLCRTQREDDHQKTSQEMRFQKTLKVGWLDSEKEPGRQLENNKLKSFSLNLSFLPVLRKKSFINSFFAPYPPLLAITMLVTGSKLNTNIVSSKRTNEKFPKSLLHFIFIAGCDPVN